MSITLDLAPVMLGFLKDRQRERGLTGPLEPATPVFSSGLLDSVALMDLIAAVEQSTGQTVDMLRFDPSEVETMEDLVASLSSALSG